MRQTPAASDQPAFDPTRRDSYRRWSMIPLRYADQDPVGHINNGAIGAYFEQSRCETLLPLITAHGGPHLDIVLARIVIDYLKEIRYPGSVDVGARIDRIGNKSLTIVCGVFSIDTCCATAIATIVFFDKQTRRSTEPPTELRAALQSLA